MTEMNVATKKMIKMTADQWAMVDAPVDADAIAFFWEQMVLDFPEAYEEDWYPLVAVRAVNATIDWEVVAAGVSDVLCELGQS